MIFPITSLCLAACIAAAYRQDGRRSGLVLALSAWALSLVLGSPVLFSYSVGYSIETDAFVAACLSAATILYLFLRRGPRPAPATYFNRRRERHCSKLLGVLGALGCLLLLADAQATNGLQFSIAYLLENLNTIRADQFAGVASAVNRGAVGTVGGFIAPCAVLSVIAAVRLGADGDRTIRLLAALNFGLVAAVSLMVFAGRATIISLGLLVILSLFLSGRRLSPFRPRTLIAGTLLVIGVWYLATSWLGTRENDPNTVDILDQTQRAQARPWIAGLAERETSLGLAMVSVGYFASPLPTLTFYMRQPNVPGPFYGAYSFQLPARVVATIDGRWTRDQWLQTRQKIYAPIESRNYFGNVWATWLRDLLVDFGRIGAILFCGLFGAFMAWARNRFELTGALHYHYLEVIACFSFGFGAFTSFLWEPFVAYPFFCAIVVMVAMRASLSADRSRHRSRGQAAGRREGSPHTVCTGRPA